jgi:hypothetical protein
MLSHIISDKNEIKSFDILHKTDLNIYVIEDNKTLYKNNIIIEAYQYGHIQVLEWFKNSGYEFKYDIWAFNNACQSGQVQILEWFKNSGYEFKYNEQAINFSSLKKVLEWFKNRNVKKVIKWSKPLKFLNTIKFKTKNNYIKGYNKN